MGLHGNTFKYISQIHVVGIIPTQDRQDDLTDLFKMSRKKEPLFFCPAGVGSTLWRPPETPKCDAPIPGSNASIANINVTVWWPALESQLLKGTECTVQSTATETTFRFDFGKFYYDWKLSNKSMTKEECTEMIRTKRSPDNEMLSLREDGIWTTEREREREYSWTKTKKYVINDYYILSKTVIVDNDKPNYIRAAAGIEKPCGVSAGACQTTEGWLIWNPEDFKTCTLSKGSRMACVLTDKFMTCPATDYGLTNIRFIELCGLKVGVSDQEVRLQNNYHRNQY